MAVFCVSCGLACAQDIHFSQIDVNPIMLNPAYSGFFDGQGRFGITYRNQWATVSQPYQTMAATAEMSLKRRRYQQDGVSLGVTASTDRAGSLNYGTTAASAILSYYKALGGGSAIVSLGIEGGYGNAGFDPADAVMTDPAEHFVNTTASFPIVGAGVALFIQPDDDFYLKLGFSSRNINRPNISYLGADDVYLEPRYTLYLRSEYRGWPDIAIQPLVLAQLQHNNMEVIVGGDCRWIISESLSDVTSFSVGARYRMFDALMINCTFEHNALLYNFCYDANISKLTPASKSVGALEFSIVYRLNTHQKIRPKAMPCPII